MTSSRSRALALVAVAAVSLSCSSPLSPNELFALRDAEARWASRPFGAYTFETSVSCFCDPYLTQWARVEVRDGVVARVVILESGEEVAPAQRPYFATVESLFESIRNAQRHDHLKDVVATYDPVLGYPTLIRFVADDNVMDGGAVRYARAAAPAP